MLLSINMVQQLVMKQNMRQKIQLPTIVHDTIVRGLSVEEKLNIFDCKFE